MVDVSTIQVNAKAFQEPYQKLGNSKSSASVWQLPKRIVEVGSGFSSALMLDVKECIFHNI